MSFLSCYYLLLFFSALHLIYAQTPSIDFVSLQSAKQGPDTRIGSILGGATLYLRGSGLSSNPSTTQVQISNTICPIQPSLTSSYQIACAVPPSSIPGTFAVKVVINGVEASCSPDVCTFTYQISATPILRSISPNAIIPYTDISFESISRVTKSSDLQIKLNNTFCDFSPFGDQTLSASTPSIVQCRAGAIPIGFYNVQFTSLLQGDGYKAFSTKAGLTPAGDTYDIAVIPQVSGLSKNSGPLSGRVLLINGNGFSRVPEENIVFYGDNSCYVLSSSYTFIECILHRPVKPNDISLKAGHTGIKARLFSTKSLDGLKKVSLLVAASQQQLLSFEIPYNTFKGFSEVLEGFFKAPVTGSFRFFLSSKGPCQLFVSKVPLSTQNLELVAEVKNETEFRNFFNPNEKKQISDPIRLEANQLYLIRAFHQDTTGEHMTVGVEIPVDGKNLFSPKQVISIEIQADVQREEAIFTFQNSESIVAILFISQGSLKTSRELTYPSSSSEVKAALADLNIQVEILSQNFYDENNTLLTPGQSSQAKAVQYRVRFLNNRGSSLLPGLTDPSLGGFTPAPQNNPTPLVSGSYTVRFLDKIISFQFNETVESIENIFNTALGQTLVTRAFLYGDCEEGCSYVIQFIENTADISSIFLASNLLTGGKSKPQVTIKVLQNAQSGSRVFAPIPYNMLFTVETVPQVTVSTNGLLASCTGNCSYTLYEATNFPTITNYSLQGTTLEINLVNADLFAVSQLRVFLSGSQALVTGFNNSPQSQKITATLPANSNRTPLLVAGTHFPIVSLDDQGLAAMDPTVAPLEVGLNIISIQAVRSGSSLLFIVQGTGFGFSIARQFATGASIGGVSCVIQVLSNTQLRCLAQISATAGPFRLQVNGKVAEYPFVFGDPDIIGSLDVSFDADNNQNILRISGSGYNSNTTAVIRNDVTQEAETCRVCLRTSQEIQCSLRGLQPGNYTVFTTTFVQPNNFLRSNKTFTIPFEVYLVSPNSGSQLGGTLLHIKGNGFSPVLNQNQVSIGAQNVRCTVVEANNTDIKCLTDPNYVQYTDPQDVVIWYRLEFNSKCLGNCGFTYSEAFTPMITQAIPQTIRAGEELILMGRNFTSSTEIKISGIKANIISVSSDQLVIEVPNIAASSNLHLSATDPLYGNYKIESSLVLNSELELLEVSPNVGSMAGTLLYLNGFGFGEDAQIMVGEQACEVISRKATQIICQTVPKSVGLVVISQSLFSNVSCDSCYYESLDSLTPVVKKITGIPAFADINVNIVLEGEYLDIANSIQVILKSDSLSIAGTIQDSSNELLSVNFDQLFAGNYILEVRLGNFLASFASDVSNIVTLNFSLLSDTPNTDVSIGGGLPITIQTVGVPSDSSLIQMTVAGFSCPIISSSYDSITFSVPAMLTSNTKKMYQLTQDPFCLCGSYFASSPQENPSLAFDNDTASSFESYTKDCYFGIDVGEGLVAELWSIEFFPEYKVDVDSLRGAVFEGSNNGKSYQLIARIQENVYEGINRILFSTEPRPSFRFLRYRKAASTSSCPIAELKFRGTVLSSLPNSDLTSVLVSSAMLSINGISNNIGIYVNYSSDITPVVKSISPAMGSSAGGTTVTLYGQGFMSTISDIDVKIDNTACKVIKANDSQIVCITGALPAVMDRTNKLNGKVEVFIRGIGNAITNGISFLYAERWSDPNTWGCDGLPAEGDSVHVPAGMNLLIDLSPPKLVAVVVEGALIFYDQPIDFQAEYITIRNGVLQIGTEDQPIENKITITLSGSRSNEKLPIFGDKVIGVYEGILDIHGKPKAMVSTFLKETAKAGQDFIILENIGDLSVGDEIVVSSTSTDFNENEKRVITAISDNQASLNSPLQYTHIAEAVNMEIEQTFEVKALVIVLTRNIVIQGDEKSEEDKYGAQMLFYDPGSENTIIRISYTEIKQAGQAGLLDRSALNFQNAGNQIRSSIQGCSIHTTYNKAIQVRGADYLTLSRNVLFDIEGDGISLTDGVERFNVIEDNAIIGIKSTLREYNADTSPAAISITNPLNFLRRNKAAGVVRAAFELNYAKNAQGAFYSRSICPQGERLGAFEDNLALSCGSPCLLLNSHFPRKYACKQSISTLSTNPLKTNPPVPAVYKNFQAARSQDVGVVFLSVGSVVLSGFKSGGNYRAGIEIRGKGGFLNSTRVTSALLLGSLGLSDGETNGPNYAGFIPPNAEGFLLEDSDFLNFVDDSSAIQTPAAGSDPGARTTFLQNLRFQNVKNRIVFNEPYVHIFKDLDGSLINSPQGGTVVSDFPHLKVPQCSASQLVENGLVCDSSVVIKRILFSGSAPTSIIPKKALKIIKLDSSEGLETSPIEATTINPNQGAWAVPFVTGLSYQLFFGPYDFKQLTIEPSIFYQPSDSPITLVFNYTEPREDFDVSKKIYLQTAQNLTNVTTIWDIYNPTTLSPGFGDFYNDVKNNKLYLGIARGNEQLPVAYEEAQSLQIAGFLCKLNCPLPIIPITNGTQSMQKKYYWSEATKWPQGKIPQAGETVIIPTGTTVVLDIDTAPLEMLEIRGELVFDDKKSSLTLTCKKIWVRGKLIVGSEAAPYDKQAIINLIGTPNDKSLVVNFAVSTGSKVLVVTGELQLVGKSVQTLARLVENVFPGNFEILVEGAQNILKPGDEIVLAPSQKNPSQTEIRTVTEINGDKVTLDIPLDYFHYGGKQSEIVTSNDVDLRTEVAILSRNINIQGDSSILDKENRIGARILVTEEYGNDQVKTGRINMQYVSLENCGKAQGYTGGLTFEVANNGDTQSLVQGVVIRNSLSYGVKLLQAKNVQFISNVVIGSQEYGIAIEGNNNNITIQDNLVVGIKTNTKDEILDIEDISAGISLIDGITNSNVSIQGNKVAGCQYACYLIRTPSCGSSSLIKNNIAHSGLIGFLAYTSSQGCFDLSDMVAYRNYLGIATSSALQELQASKLTVIDNKYGIYVNTARKSGPQVQIENSLIAALPLEPCEGCYTDSQMCSNQVGIMLETTEAIKKLIPLSLEEGQTEEDNGMLSSKQSITNTVFINFKDSIYPQCTNNVIVAPNKATSDYAPLIEMSQSHLTNVQTDALVLFPLIPSTPSPQCDGMVCTGPLNTLIKDEDGSFVGTPNLVATILPNNPGVIDQNLCSFKPKMNGYICQSDDFGVLTFESLDTNQCSVVASPVSISGNNEFSNNINAFREHYDELECDNPRFTSIVQTQQTYDVKFPSTTPTNLTFQLQGHDEDFVIVKIEYKKPRVIIVSESNTRRTIDSLVTKPGDNSGINSNDPCGANIMDSTKGVIQFKITGEKSCRLMIEQANALLFTIRFDIDVNEFFSQGGLAPFIDKVAVILGIPSRRIKVVGVFKGSTIIHTAIIAEAQGVKQQSEAEEELQIHADKIQKAVENNELVMYDATILNFSTNILVKDVADIPTIVEASVASENKNLVLLGFLIIGLPILAVILVVFTAYKCKKYRKKSKLVTRILPDGADAGGQRQSCEIAPSIDVSKQQGNSIGEVKDETGRQDDMSKLENMSSLRKLRQEQLRSGRRSNNTSLSGISQVITPNESFSKLNFLTPKKVRIEPFKKREMEAYIAERLKTEGPLEEKKKHKRRSFEIPLE